MDLSFLNDLTRLPGPWATAYLDVSRGHENAGHEIELRWRALADSLREQGADRNTVHAMHDALAEDQTVPDADGRCLVAAGGRVRFDRPLPDRPRRTEARWSPLPHLMPYLAQLPRSLPYVVAVVDRTGADLYAFEPSPAGLLRTADERVVSGGDRPVTKVRAGGWSQRRYQRRAENLWQANAGEVADMVHRLAAEVRAEQVLVAGDPRARAALRDALPADTRDLLVEIEGGGRGLGASEDAIADEVAAALDERYARDRDATLDAWRARPAEGLADTVAALRERRVATLLLREAAGDDDGLGRTVFVGPEPDQLAVGHDELAALGADRTEPERADSALLRAAAASGAGLLILSPNRGDPRLDPAARPDDPDLSLRDGVGHLARYDPS